MHIILVSDRRAKTHSLELRLRHALAAFATVSIALFALSLLIFYFSVRNAAALQWPALHELLRSAQQSTVQHQQDHARRALAHMTVKLGELQAKLWSLDALGQRVAELSGLKAQDFQVETQSGRGGDGLNVGHALSYGDLSAQLVALNDQTETRADYLSAVESQLLDTRAAARMVPSGKPLEGSFIGSGYGWRSDPFTGQRAMHQGLDFAAASGTPILAAASGIVISAGPHSGYGNMVEIDHGNGIHTRYAHASKLLVHEGEVVEKLQEIAEVGSTGRSTGPHLHFEVLVHDVAQNPNRFLRSNSSAQLARAP